MGLHALAASVLSSGNGCGHSTASCCMAVGQGNTCSTFSPRQHRSATTQGLSTQLPETKLIGNTSRTSEPQESALEQPHALFHGEHLMLGGHISSTRSCAKSAEGKAPCPQKAMGGEGSLPCDTSSGEQRLDPHLGSPITHLGHIPTHMPLIPLAPAATCSPCLQSCIKD